MGNKPKKFNFVHQTVSRREACAGCSRDYFPPTTTIAAAIVVAAVAVAAVAVAAVAVAAVAVAQKQFH